MKDLRQKNKAWTVVTDTDGMACAAHAQLAVLLDIRDELQTLKRLIGGPNFTAILSALRRISANTHKPKKKRKASRQ